MAAHVGSLLREVYINSNFKMKALVPLLPFKEKSVYRHFKEEDMSTGVIRAYAVAFHKLGLDVDLFHLLYLRERGMEAEAKPASRAGFTYRTDESMQSMTAEPLPERSPLAEVARKLEDAARLLRQEEESRRGVPPAQPAPAAGS